MKAKFQNITITKEFLDQNQTAFYVYSDNGQKTATPEDAQFRGYPRAIGFVTRKMWQIMPSSFFRPEEYIKPFFDQLKQLRQYIQSNPGHTFYISKLGYSTDNYYYIWEKIIGHNLIDDLAEFENVIFCWENTLEPQAVSSPTNELANNDKDDKIRELELKLDEAYAVIDAQRDEFTRNLEEVENSVDSSYRSVRYYSKSDDLE